MYRFLAVVNDNVESALWGYSLENICDAIRLVAGGRRWRVYELKKVPECRVMGVMKRATERSRMNREALTGVKCDDLPPIGVRCIDATSPHRYYNERNQ